jgi:type I restriction enzyme, S subunit
MSWEVVEMKTFLSERKGRYKPDDRSIAGLKRIEKIDFLGNIYLSKKHSKTGMILIKQGDLVISGINVEKGAMSIYKGKEDIIATIHYSSYKYNPEKINIEFLRHFLKSPEFIEALKDHVPGGIKTEIKPKHILPLKVCIPTNIDEQKDIVDFLDKQNHKLDNQSAELTHQLNLVKKLRQAFLREAMQGKLVPQDPNDEPASMLFEKVKSNNERLIQEKKIKKMKHLPPIAKEEIPFKIPENWVWCRLGEIINFGPSNGYSPKESSKETDIRCLTLTATTKGSFNQNYFKYVDIEIDENSYLFVRDGDILLQRGNSIDFVGIAALCRNVTNKIIYPDLMIKIRVGKDISAEYIHRLLISPFWRKHFQENASGAQKTMPKINQGIVTKTLIPLPPLAEQHRIIAKLDELMQYCDKLETSIKESQSQNELLLQQVLREALEPKT